MSRIVISQLDNLNNNVRSNKPSAIMIKNVFVLVTVYY